LFFIFFAVIYLMSNLKVYCQSCGCAHAYTLQKPNFCQKCGESLGGSPKASKAMAQLQLEEQTPDFQNLGGLQFGLETFDAGPQTLGSIMEQHSSSPPSPVDHQREKNPNSHAETLEQLKKESSAIRPNSSS
jgi:hypothetical protein